MEKKWTGLVAMVVLGLNGLMAQDTTVIWHNTLNEIVGREAAPFYRLGWEENGKWRVEEHFGFGPIYETGQYTDSSCTVKSGTFKTYSKRGVKRSETQYEQNDRVGSYITWYESGTVNTQGQYGQDTEPLPEEESEDESDADDYWNPQNASATQSSDEKGVKTGRWEYYDSDGQLRAEEEYDSHGRINTSQYWKADGSPGHHGVTERDAYFHGGEEALIRFLGKNMEYPEEDQTKGRSGEVLVSFLVGIDGTVTDPRIERSASPTMNAECLRLMSIMPKWKPAKNQNRHVATRYFLPLRFTDMNRRKQEEMIRKISDEQGGQLHWKR